MTRRMIPATVLLAACLFAVMAAQSADRGVAPSSAESGGFEDLIKPSRTAQLSFRFAGTIARRPVMEGDTVRVGTTLAELDSDMERAALKLSRLKSESAHEINAATMSEEQARVELGRVSDLFDRQPPMATKWEHEKARVEWEIARIRTEYARFQHRLAEQEYARDQVAFDKRSLLAPWDGKVYKVLKEVGEAVAESTPIIELSQLDPLWIELKLTREQAGNIKLGQQAKVTCLDDESQSRAGKVIFIDRQADAASSTFRVRIEIPNADGAMQAGLRARVKFE